MPSGATHTTPSWNMEHATSDNICFYMAINQINKGAVRCLVWRRRRPKNVRAVPFNFLHALSRYQGACPHPGRKGGSAAGVIREMMKAGRACIQICPALSQPPDREPLPTPCHQCVVVEKTERSTCGRCIEVPGLCRECGYFLWRNTPSCSWGHPRIVLGDAGWTT